MIHTGDDYTHPVGPEMNFNESMYFQFYDPEQRLGGFLRLANRPNEGVGERTVCLYLPDGTLAFGYARPQVHGNDAMMAAGLAIEVAEPMHKLRVTFVGDVSMLADPRSMIDPKRAMSTSPTVDCSVALEYNALTSAHEQTFDGDGAAFAPNHYEQLATVRGRISVGPKSFMVNGHGLRDHSWGPRSWQAPWFYRWLHGSSATRGFMVAYFGDPDGTSRRGGFVFDDGRLHPCVDVEISTERDDDDYQRTVSVIAHGEARSWRFDGVALSSVPLRHRSVDGSAHTRIVESAVRWRCSDELELHGMAEYLDQIQDGRPVGQSV